MIYFLYEVNCCFLSILLHKYLILFFSLLILEKSSFESNFGLIQQPNKLAPDYSYSLLIVPILMAACLRQIEMSHAKEGELLRTQFDNGKTTHLLHF